MARFPLPKAKKNKNKPPPIPVISLVWLTGQFDSLRRGQATILKNIDEVEEGLVIVLAEVKKLSGSGNVIPELEAAVRACATRALALDRKVPDQKINEEK